MYPCWYLCYLRRLIESFLTKNPVPSWHWMLEIFLLVFSQLSGPPRTPSYTRPFWLVVLLAIGLAWPLRLLGVRRHP